MESVFDGEYILVKGQKMLNEIKRFMEFEEKNFKQELRYTFEEFAERLGYENTYLLILVIEGKMEGYCLFTDKDDDALENGIYLDTIIVRIHGKGYGKRMHTILEKVIRTMAKTSISLRTEEEKKPDGIDLVRYYLKLGYEIISKDAKGVLMRKILELSSDDEQTGPTIELIN